MSFSLTSNIVRPDAGIIYDRCFLQVFGPEWNKALTYRGAYATTVSITRNRYVHGGLPGVNRRFLFDH